MPEKHPDTERIGGPGASHENRKHPEKSQARNQKQRTRRAGAILVFLAAEENTIATIPMMLGSRVVAVKTEIVHRSERCKVLRRMNSSYEYLKRSLTFRTLG